MKTFQLYILASAIVATLLTTSLARAQSRADVSSVDGPANTVTVPAGSVAVLSSDNNSVARVTKMSPQDQATLKAAFKDNAQKAPSATPVAGTSNAVVSTATNNAPTNNAPTTR